MYRVKKLEFWLFVTVFVLFASSFSNAAVTSKTRKFVASSLAAKIKKDFTEKDVNVEIKRVAEIQMTAKKQALFGEAEILDQSKIKQAPIYFEAVVNLETNAIKVVDYKFIEEGSEVNTDFLQVLVIKSVSDDYKTREVAVSMDNVELIEEVGKPQKFRGYGEVRIGDLIWKKIKFEITLDTDSERVIYKLYKM